MRGVGSKNNTKQKKYVKKIKKKINNNLRKFCARDALVLFFSWRDSQAIWKRFVSDLAVVLNGVGFKVGFAGFICHFALV